MCTDFFGLSSVFLKPMLPDGTFQNHHGIGILQSAIEPSSDNVMAIDINNCVQIKESLLHRNIGDVCVPNLIRLVYINPISK